MNLIDGGHEARPLLQNGAVVLNESPTEIIVSIVPPPDLLTLSSNRSHSSQPKSFRWIHICFTENKHVDLNRIMNSYKQIA